MRRLDLYAFHDCQREVERCGPRNVGGRRSSVVAVTVSLIAGNSQQAAFTKVVTICQDAVFWEQAVVGQQRWRQHLEPVASQSKGRPSADLQ